MKKLFVVSLFVFLLGFVYAEEKLGESRIHFFTPGTPDFSVTQTFDYNLIADDKLTTTGYSTIFNFDMKELGGSCGIFANSSYFDFTTQVMYWPTINNKANLGLALKYHFSNCQNDFCCNDFIIDFVSNYSLFNRKVDFFFNVGFLLKLSGIRINEVDNWLPEKSLEFGFKFSYFPDRSMEEEGTWTLFVSAMSYSYFDYTLFHTFYAELGCVKKITEIFALGFNVNTKYVDLITISAIPSQFGFRFSGKVML